MGDLKVKHKEKGKKKLLKYLLNKELLAICFWESASFMSTTEKKDLTNKAVQLTVCLFYSPRFHILNLKPNMHVTGKI